MGRTVTPALLSLLDDLHLTVLHIHSVGGGGTNLVVLMASAICSFSVRTVFFNSFGFWPLNNNIEQGLCFSNTYRRSPSAKTFRSFT